MPALNIFIDESGNFDFSPNGTRYFLLTAVSTTDCDALYSDYFRLRHRIAATGLGLEEFHATEDRQAVRNQMFDLLQEHVAHGCFTVDAVIAQKNKTHPSIQDDAGFYARLLRILLRWVFRHRATTEVDKINAWAARIGTRKKRTVFEKAVKSWLANDLNARVPYDVFTLGSASHPMLQVADYCCWALNKKWKDGDTRPYEKIRKAVLTEFDVFRVGRTEYY